MYVLVVLDSAGDVQVATVVNEDEVEQVKAQLTTLVTKLNAIGGKGTARLVCAQHTPKGEALTYVADVLEELSLELGGSSLVVSRLL